MSLAIAMRRFARAAALGLVLAAAFAAPAALAETNAEYEARIAALEARIARLEALVERIAPDGGEAAVAARDPGGAAAASSGGGDAAAGDAAARAAAAAAAAEAKKEDEDALQELYAVRDKAVTLQPGRWQADLEFIYARDDDFLRTSWALGAVAALRYGLPSGFELSLSAPYDWTYRRTETGSKDGRVEELADFGDLTISASKTVFRETADWPGVVISTGLVIPTGVDPYHEGEVRKGSLPSDPFTFYRNAAGHYSVSLGAEFIKTYDPFAFFAGVNVNYLFPRDVGGTEIAPAPTVGFNLGGTFVVSEKTSLGFTLLGSVEGLTKSGGRDVPGTDAMPLATTFSVLHRLTDGFYLQPALTTGLTADAPDAVFSLTTTKTF